MGLGSPLDPKLLGLSSDILQRTAIGTNNNNNNLAYFTTLKVTRITLITGHFRFNTLSGTKPTILTDERYDRDHLHPAFVGGVPQGLVYFC